MSKVYRVITTVDITDLDDEGNVFIIPSNSVINRILWDGETEYTSPPNTILELEE